MTNECVHLLDDEAKEEDEEEEEEVKMKEPVVDEVDFVPPAVPAGDLEEEEVKMNM